MMDFDITFEDVETRHETPEMQNIKWHRSEVLVSCTVPVGSEIEGGCDCADRFGDLKGQFADINGTKYKIIGLEKKQQAIQDSDPVNILCWGYAYLAKVVCIVE